MQEFLEKTMSVKTSRCMKADPEKADRVLRAVQRAMSEPVQVDTEPLEFSADGGSRDPSRAGSRRGSISPPARRFGRRKSIDDIDRQHSKVKDPGTSQANSKSSSRAGSRRPSMAPDP